MSFPVKVAPPVDAGEAILQDLHKFSMQRDILVYLTPRESESSVLNLYQGQLVVPIVLRQISVFGDQQCLPIVAITIGFGELFIWKTFYALNADPESEEQKTMETCGDANVSDQRCISG